MKKIGTTKIKKRYLFAIAVIVVCLVALGLNYYFQSKSPLNNFDFDLISPQAQFNDLQPTTPEDPIE